MTLKQSEQAYNEIKKHLIATLDEIKNKQGVSAAIAKINGLINSTLQLPKSGGVINVERSESICIPIKLDLEVEINVSKTSKTG